MTNKIEYGVEYDGFNEVFEAFRSDKDGGEWLGDFKTYNEAFTCAYQAALEESAGGPEVVFPDWDSPTKVNFGEEPDEDEGDLPVLAPGAVFVRPAIFADENGELWWVDPQNQVLKRAG